MNRLLLFLIGLTVPRAQREWVLGDTLEGFEQRAYDGGARAARRWLWRELGRMLTQAPAARAAAPSSRNEPRTQGAGAMAGISQDVRYALRWLGRSPGFAVVAIATLAIGIGANTAMFAVVNGVLLKPLPFANADRLMLVHLLFPERDAGPGVFRSGVWSYPKYRTFAGIQDVFEDTALFSTARDYTLSGDGEPERLRGEVITDRYGPVLGVAPVLGRGFTGLEAQRAGAPAVAMIGEGLWQRRFGGEAGVLGRAIEVDGRNYTVVGVFPRGFRGLTGLAEVWLPLAVAEPSQLTEAQSHSYTVVARRKPGVGEQAADAAARVYGTQVDAAHLPRSGVQRSSAAAASLYSSRADADVRRAAWVVLGAVGFVLLIACANLTNLLVAKALGRRREVAVRVALGASRGRIVRQFGVESLVLTGLGAAAGLGVAALLLAVAAALLPDSDVFFRTSMAPGVRRTMGAAGLTRIGAGSIGLDLATLLFTLGVAGVTALLVAVLPAFQASARPPADTLKSAGGTGTARGHHGFGVRAVLVAAQIALALVLLAGAGLMVKSAARLHGTGIGVSADRLLTARIDLPRAAYAPEAGTAFFINLAERVRALPGVESVGLGYCPPVSGGCNSTSLWFPPTGALTDSRNPLVGVHWITPEQLPTLGIRVLRGRGFTDRDRTGQPRVVLVNEAAARTHWPNADPIGKRVAVGQGGFHVGAEVIGVVSNVRYTALETAATPDVYVPLLQSYQSRMRLFVRSPVEPAALATAIRDQVRALDPNLPLVEVKTMGERVSDAMWRTRVAAWLLSAFAGLALLLTAIGVFGVMAQTVIQRTPEIGIRLALGAQRRDVLSLVLGRAALVTGAGLTAGVAAASLLTRLIGSLLHGVEATDPATFVTVVGVLGLVSMAACYIPARRATRVDAVVALRSDQA